MNSSASRYRFGGECRLTSQSGFKAALVLSLFLGCAATDVRAQGSSLTLPEVMSFSFPTDLVAASQGGSIAWLSHERGIRSVWVANAPNYKARQIAGGREDDGQKLSALAFSGDGKRLIWARGGDPGARAPAGGGPDPNPTSSPTPPRREIWSASLVDGSPAKVIAEGSAPVPSPRGDAAVFERGGELWSVPIDGGAPPERLFYARGRSESPAWSPDGKALAFVSNRGTHSFIALFTRPSEPIRYLAPSAALDSTPRWSPDGSQIAFIRQPARGTSARPLLGHAPLPWSVWVVRVETGEAREVWRSPETLAGSYGTLGVLRGADLQWAAGHRIAFLSYHDGWPHLYSVPSSGGEPTLLTPGSFMVEEFAVTPDREGIIYCANAGGHPDDIDRRHLFRVSADRADARPLTSGDGIEWAPAPADEGRTLAFLGSSARTPPTIYTLALGAREPQPIAAQGYAADYPSDLLVVPERVTFQAPDGTVVDGQIFKSTEGEALRPAVVFIHGGAHAQTLLGWHHRAYHANAYALNQYLASRGYIVLSVNYRLSIGYGLEFERPPQVADWGAADYQDILAAGRYLRSRPDVAPNRIGVWGGSYGGYLTALALARNSDVFAAGVDIAGVHNWVEPISPDVAAAAAVGDGTTRAKLDEVMRIAWESSPVSSVGTWRSPVLLIHADDDRNVQVEQTLDLARRLEQAGVRYEVLILPDEVHSFLLYRSWLRVYEATSDFFDHTLREVTERPED